MVCHLAALSGYFFPLGWVLGPLLIWQIKKAEFPSIEAHGRESVNFHLSLLIYSVVAGILAFVLIGLPFLLVFAVMQVVCSVIAAVKANHGVDYRYPLTIRFL